MRHIPRHFAAVSMVITLAGFSLYAASVSAEHPVAFRQLGVIDPPAVQRGKTTEIKIHSNFTLDKTHTAFAVQPGVDPTSLKLTFVEKKPIAAPWTARGRKGVPFRFSADVPKTLPTGIYEVRAATPIGVSSASHLLVTDFPVVSEMRKDNGTQQSAQPIELPVTVTGFCETSEDVDFFRFNAKKGQSLSFQAYSQRITEAVHSMQASNNVYSMDTLLTLYGPNGQVVAQNDNFYGGDSLLLATIPMDGSYALEVRDSRYLGNDKFIYAVEISDRPFVTATFPFAVQRGKAATLELTGNGLGRSTTTKVTVSSQEALGLKQQSLKLAEGETNAIPLLVSDRPQINVTSPGLTQSAAISIPVPAEVNGRIQAPLQTHYYSFVAKKGTQYRVEIESHRHGFPLDSVLGIYDPQGRMFMLVDDVTRTKDAEVRFTATSDGVHKIAITDLHDRGGERFVYHLKLNVVQPDFAVSGEYYYAQIAPGSRMIWWGKVQRLDGFNGPVEIGVENLPKGVTAVPVTLPPNMTQCAIILEAAKDVPIGATLVRTFGRAKLPQPDGSLKEEIRYGSVTCELQTQGGSQVRQPIQTQLVGVVEPMDLIEFEATPARVVLLPGKKAEIKVRLKRHPKFTDAVNLAMDFDYFRQVYGAQLPPGVTVDPKSTLRIGPKQTEGTIILAAAPNAGGVENLPIAVVGRVSISFSITTNYASSPVLLTVPAKQGGNLASTATDGKGMKGKGKTAKNVKNAKPKPAAVKKKKKVKAGT